MAGNGRILVLACALWLALVAPAGASQKYAFADPVTGELMTHGYVERNRPGDVRVAVASGFNLEPHRWRWTGTQWAPFVPAPTPEEARLMALRTHVDAVLADPVVPPKLKDVLNAIKDFLR